MAKFFGALLASICLLGFSTFQVHTAPSELSSAQTSLTARQSSNDDVQIEEFFVETTKSPVPVAIAANGTYYVAPNAPVTTTLKIVESQTVSSYTIRLYDGKEVYGPFALKSVGEIELIGGGFKRLHFLTSVVLPTGHIYVIDKVEVTIVTNVKTVNATFPGPFVFIVA